MTQNYVTKIYKKYQEFSQLFKLNLLRPEITVLSTVEGVLHTGDALLQTQLDSAHEVFHHSLTVNKTVNSERSDLSFGTYDGQTLVCS